MYWIKFTLGAIILSYSCATASNDTKLFEFGPKQLHRFDNIGDQEIFHWDFDFPNKYLLRFSGTVNQTGGGFSVHCADTVVHLLVRKGALPIPNPLQTIVPENTFVQSISLQSNNTFTISQSQELFYDVIIDPSDNKTAGHYFASVFLPNQEETIDVAGLTKECKYYAKIQVYNQTGDSGTTDVTPATGNTTKLIRRENGLFNVQFNSDSATFNASSDTQQLFEWEILPVKDSGGIMRITVESKPSEDTTSYLVEACVNQLEYIASDNCNSGQLLTLNGTSGGERDTWHFPYPIAGPWYLTTTFKCHGNTSNNCQAEVDLRVSVGSCIDGCHSNKGQGSCGLYRTDEILFLSCSCKVGWRGIACNDGTEALSYGEQLLQTLLLTLSNFMFLPCVALAIYRKFYTEALVYFFVAFMSSFYHACDQPGAAVYCIMKYETLQFSDFLSSVSAIWFTLVAVAKPPQRIESWLHVAGCLGFAVGVSYDRFSVWTVVIPGVIGVVMVIAAWGLQCHNRHACYPSKKKIFLSYIPGLACAGTGLALYAFVETSDNYYIVHSLWHILMATAVLFLLPIGPKYKEGQSYNTNKIDLQRQPFALEPSDNMYHSYSDTNLHVD
uniref:Transmembrane protein 8B-like n=1 Tax=Phallusia mammillata TaxID=59560 RepID=A0A6F9DVT9_9ASCI|nr:transmembrane protein 8B-like [Phallusia mammillata]